MTGSWLRGPLSLLKRNGLMEVLLRASAVWYGRAMTAALESSLMPSHASWRCVLPQTQTGLYPCLHVETGMADYPHHANCLHTWGSCGS